MTDRHQQKPYPLRMPDELRTRLEEAAQIGSRSLHAEIIARLQSSLEQSLPAPENAKSYKMSPDFLDELEKLLDAKLQGVTAIFDTGEGLKKDTLMSASKPAKKIK